MANSRQAAKRARQSELRRQLRSGQRAAGRTAVKKVLAAIEAEDREASQTLYRSASAKLDQLANKGVIHANKVARHKRRLNIRLRSLIDGGAEAP